MNRRARLAAAAALVLLVAATALFVRASRKPLFASSSGHTKAPDSSDPWAWERWDTAEGFISVDTEEGLPPLHKAAGKGDLTAATRLLSQGGDPNACDKDGWTPLHWAAYEGQTEMVEFLLRKGALPDAKAYALTREHFLAPDMFPRATPAKWRSIHKRTNATPLKAALAKGRQGAAALLMDQLSTPESEKDALLLWSAQHGYGGGIDILVAAGAHADVPDKDGWTPLHWAALNQYPAAVQALLEHGADANARTRSKEFRRQMLYRSPAGETPLHLARGNAEVLELLVAKGADVNARDALGQTPLHVAGWSADGMKVLLAHGADVNARDNAGKTPLVEAMQYLDTQAFDALLARGADVNATDGKGRTPLYSALDDPRTAPTKTILDHGAKVDVRDDEGQTPLHYLAGHSWDASGVDKAKSLLDRGADPTAKDKSGATPLDVAAQSGSNHDLIQFLRKQMAARSGKPEPGTTPLHEATSRGDVKLVATLLDGGAEVNAQNGDGLTPLYCAVAEAHVDVVKLLLARGADPSIGDMLGWTPLHRAAYDGRTDIAELLLSHGAKVGAKATDGDQPLHLAVQRGNHDTAKLLLTKGADPNAVGRDGDTPLIRAFAIETEIEYTGPVTDDMIELLKKYGAKDSY